MENPVTVSRSTMLRAGIGLTVAALGACNDSPFGGITDTISASILTGDTTLFVDQNAVFTAQAVYGIGPGFPTSIQWGVTDATKLRVTVLNDLSGNVVALDTGSAWVVARINVDFVDSAQVVVVAPGLVRWRATVAGGLGLYPAVGLTDSTVRVSGIGTTLATFGFSGTAGPTAANTCNGYYGPSVGDDGAAYVTGTDCTRRHAVDLGVSWAAPIGDAEGSVAVAANGDAVVLHSEANAVVVSRLAAVSGNEVWRDTLKATGLTQESSLAIAANGEIYVAWRAPADSSWLTRIGGDGTPRWVIELPAWPHRVGPALSGNRVLVTYLGGISVVDTAGGAPVWSRQFSDDDPGAPADVQPSAAVVDRAGNVYVQTVRALHSYTSAGAPRWTADSLGGGSSPGGVGSPTLLNDTTVVIGRGGNRVCGVVGGTGVPRWCSASLTGAGDLLGGAMVGPDRTIYVTRTGGEVIALWSNTVAEFGSWSTEGGNHQRSRRR
jgi:hypothetical protein